MEFVTSLSISTNWKDDSYESILVIIDELIKMIHYEPIKVMIYKSGLAKVIIHMVMYYYRVPDSIVRD